MSSRGGPGGGCGVRASGGGGLFFAPSRATAAAIALAAPTPTTAPASAIKPPALTKQQLDFFETKIRPVLAANCYRCHSIESGKAKGDLTLDTREGWQKGGENGPVIIPGDP